MVKDKGVKVPLLGRFTGRVRTPLTILGAFFALGVVLDLFMEFVSKWVFKDLQKRVHLGFKFWMLPDDIEYTLEDGTVVNYNETIAYDDLILLMLTLAIPFLLIRRTTLRNKIVAMAGFFFGWYASSLWISPRIAMPEATGNPTSNSSSSSSTPQNEIYGGE